MTAANEFKTAADLLAHATQNSPIVAATVRGIRNEITAHLLDAIETLNAAPQGPISASTKYWKLEVTPGLTQNRHARVVLDEKGQLALVTSTLYIANHQKLEEFRTGCETIDLIGPDRAYFEFFPNLGLIHFKYMGTERDHTWDLRQMDEAYIKMLPIMAVDMFVRGAAPDGLLPIPQARPA